MNGSFPAPWSVESFTSQEGGVVWEVRDALGAAVVVGVERERAEAIAISRNDAAPVDDVQRIRVAYQGAIDALNSDLASVREEWHKQVAGLHEQIDRYRDEIAALKQAQGQLI